MELKILKGLIMSDQVCRELIPLIRKDYFEVENVRKVFRWVSDFYSEYKRAPKGHIIDIYNDKKINLSSTESELVGDFLDKVIASDEELNIDYLVDSSREYLKRRSLEVLQSTVRRLTELGKLDAAEDEIRHYRQVVKHTSEWVNPFDEDYQKTVLETSDHYLFQMPGELGRLMKFKRDWLVGITAPFKRGKSHFLLEIGVEALFSRLKVVVFTLEMPDRQVSERLYRRLTALGNEKRVYVYPVWDCEKNQYGTCTRKERCNRIPLMREGETLPEYRPDMEYRPCTYCKEKGLDDYVQSTWFASYEREKLNLKILTKYSRGFKMMYGDNIRIISHPPFYANSEVIRRDLEVLEYSEDFVPDVLIVDYADIMGPEDKGLTGIEKEDKTWIALEALSRELHCLVVTATQGTRDSLDARDIKQRHTSRWVGKLGHVDVMYVLNQTEDEKKLSIMRVGVMLHRHMQFSESDQVRVLYQFELGQTVLDSDQDRKNLK